MIELIAIVIVLERQLKWFSFKCKDKHFFVFFEKQFELRIKIKNIISYRLQLRNIHISLIICDIFV